MTVELDQEAYDILCRQKGSEQSFSEVIKERLGSERQGTVGDLLELVKDLEISEDTLDRIEEAIQSRSQHPVRNIAL
jgi:predicted CopG family antitoxin